MDDKHRQHVLNIFFERIVMGQSFELPKRFWDKVNKIDGRCWEWTGAKDEKGYGLYRHGGIVIRSHRVSLMSTGIDLSGELVAMHSCDNPPCVNPSHLSAGTVRDNNEDRESKKRGKMPRLKGEDAPWSTLNEEIVKTIKREFKLLPRSSGGMKVKKGSLRELSKRLGVSHQTMIAVIIGRSWNHVKID